MLSDSTHLAAGTPTGWTTPKLSFLILMISLVIIWPGHIGLGATGSFLCQRLSGLFSPPPNRKQSDHQCAWFDRARAPGSTSPFCSRRALLRTCQTSTCWGAGKNFFQEKWFLLAGDGRTIPHARHAPTGRPEAPRTVRSNTFDAGTGVGWLSTQMQEIISRRARAHDAPLATTNSASTWKWNAGSLI